MASTRPAGVMSISWDFSGAIRMAEGIASDTRRADAPIHAAHEASAILLQEQIAMALQDATEKRGRDQRRGDLLVRAIMSDLNRTVTLSGFTVGYLDRIKRVRLYYRNLEEGTAVFVGTYLQGAFQDAEGGLSFPEKRTRRKGRDNVLFYGGQQRLPPGGVDAGRVNGGKSNNIDGVFKHFVRAGRGRGPRFLITHQITGYHYISDGYKNWATRFGRLNIGLYRLKFKEAGLANLDRLLAPYGSDAVEALLPEVTIRLGG